LNKPRIPKCQYVQIIAVSICLLFGSIASAQLTKLPGQEKKAAAPFHPWAPPKGIQKTPDDFNAPVYTSNVDLTKFSKLDPKLGSSTNALIETSDAPEVAFKWYQSTLKSQGWEIELPPSSRASADLFMLTAKKSGQKIIFSSFRPPKLNATLLSVCLSSE